MKVRLVESSTNEYFTNDEKEQIRQCSEESGVDPKGFEKYIKDFIKRVQDTGDRYLSRVKNIYELSKEDVKKLRSEIILGSYYTSDYENSFGIDARMLSSIMDGWEEELSDPDTPYEDTAEDLYDYIHYSVEWDDDYLNQMTNKAKEDIAKEYSVDAVKEYLFSQEGIYNIVGDYQRKIVKSLLNESASGEYSNKLYEIVDNLDEGSLKEMCYALIRWLTEDDCEEFYRIYYSYEEDDLDESKKCKKISKRKGKGECK